MARLVHSNSTYPLLTADDMTIESKVTDCPLCSNTSKIELKWHKRFSIASCKSCKLLFSTPMPDERELQEFYQGFLYRKPDVAKIESLAQKKCSELHKYFGKRKSGSTFLDFGAGTGITTNAAMKLGWDVHFQDVDQKAHEFVAENLDIKQNRMHYSMEDIPLNHFDMIMCDNVIEHVTDPVGLVRDLSARLRDGGSLVFKTPNAFNTELYFFPKVCLLGYVKSSRTHTGSSKDAFKILRKRFWNCDPPRHLFSFTKPSFEKVCELADESDFQIGYYNTPNFEYLILPNVLKHPKLSVGWLSRLGLGAFEILSKPIYLVLKLLNLISPSGISLTIQK